MDHSPDPVSYTHLVREVLHHDAYGKAAEACCRDFRSCTGAAGAAEFIENAPHSSNGTDVVAELKKANARFQRVYWIAISLVILLTGLLFRWRHVWIIGVAAGILSNPIGRAIQKRNYAAILKRIRK